MLIELLVAMTMMVVVLTGVLVVLEKVTAGAAAGRERTQGIREGQSQLDALVREARHTYKLETSTATRLDVNVHVRGVTRRVVFDCSVAHPTLAGTKRCTRTQKVGSGAWTTPQVVIDRVLNSNVFTYTTSGTVTSYVGVTIELPASGERKVGYAHRIRLNDGFATRNISVIA